MARGKSDSGYRVQIHGQDNYFPLVIESQTALL